MKKRILVVYLTFLALAATSQTYTHPTTGMQNQYVGACMISSCSGTYYDNGGAGANYSNNINGTYVTFCPNAAGKCIRLAFTSFNIEGGAGCPFDYFEIENGPLQVSPGLVGGCGNWGAGFGTYTSTDASGCLTCRFWSDFSNKFSGWAATISCQNCAGPNGTDNNDCVRATQICSNSTFNGSSTGPGIVSEGCQNGATTATDCNLSENCTNWYSFQINTTGNLVLTIAPVTAGEDYDFALYGPGASCAALGSPIRCSYACYGGGCNSPSASTGINSANDLVQVGAAEDVNGDGWVSTLPVTAGQIYYLMVNKWAGGGSGYSLNWTGSTANFTCGGVLPIDLISFDAKFKGKYVELDWSTATELNNDHFTIEKSYDGYNFNPLAQVRGAGNSIVQRNYTFEDKDFTNGIIYYRLRFTDYAGRSKTSEVSAVSINLYEDYFYVHADFQSPVVQLFYNNPNAAKTAQLQLFNSQGQLISAQAVTLEPGTNEHDVDVSAFSPGIYFVVLERDGVIMRGKFAKP